MQIKKVIFGCLGSAIVLILFSLIIDILSKPIDRSISLNPFAAIDLYLFGFGFIHGFIGIIIGMLGLVAILVLGYSIGVCVYKFLMKKPLK